MAESFPSSSPKTNCRIIGKGKGARLRAPFFESRPRAAFQHGSETVQPLFLYWPVIGIGRYRRRRGQVMRFTKIRNIAFLAVSAAGLSACTIYDGYGTGYSSNPYANKDYPDECYDKDGYLYADCEDASYIARNGYGYGSLFYNDRYGPYGWYDGYYYPGHSYYIYDRRGRRHNWNERQRRHWEGRRQERRDHDGRSGNRRNRDGVNRDQRRGDARDDRRTSPTTTTPRNSPYPPLTPGTRIPGEGRNSAVDAPQTRNNRGTRNRTPQAQPNAAPRNARPPQADPAPPPATTPRSNRRAAEPQRPRNRNRDEHPE